MKKYDPKIEAQMRSFSQALSEKDRRQYAALEARKLGHGGQTPLCPFLGCVTHRIYEAVENRGRN